MKQIQRIRVLLYIAAFTGLAVIIYIYGAVRCLPIFGQDGVALVVFPWNILPRGSVLDNFFCLDLLCSCFSLSYFV